MPTMTIKTRVLSIVDRYGTNCPAEIAEKMDIEIVIPYLPSSRMLGLFTNMENQKVIICNGILTPEFQKVILAHELGHAVMHSSMNMFFIRDHTLFPAGKFEYQANTFAAEMLITDELLHKYKGYTISEIASIENIHPKLFRYKKLT
jgi:Zn-dependent peptidase ImmA (M78 family)